MLDRTARAPGCAVSPPAPPMTLRSNSAPSLAVQLCMLNQKAKPASHALRAVGMGRRLKRDVTD
jgi:hypothetical protein